MAVIQAIIEQHAEEAAFLWLLRDEAVKAPHYRLKDLMRLDQRIEGHVDGLRIAGEQGWLLVREKAQAFQEPGELFAMTMLALESADNRPFQESLAIAESAPEAVRGLISALGWAAPEQLSGRVKALLLSTQPLHRTIGIAACAIHRVDPGAYLAAALRDEHPTVRARALRTAGELKRRDLLHFIADSSLYEEDPQCRYWTAWSLALLARRITILQDLVVTASPLSLPALQVLLRLLDSATSQQLLGIIARSPERCREALIGAGIRGDPVYIPWLMAHLENPLLARVAGESFSMITGVDIAYEDLDRDAPEGFQAGPSENPADEDVALDVDENLAWPDSDRLRNWWQKNGGRFQSGVRYLSGLPIGEAACQDLLARGYQRQRIAVALELALMRLGTPLFETRAPAWHQQRLILSPSHPV